MVATCSCARSTGSARLVQILATLLALTMGLCPVGARADGVFRSPTAGCAGGWSRASVVKPVLVLECRPGFASEHDRISIFSRQPVADTGDWHDDLNFSDAVWIFDAGATGRASLVVDFHPNRQGPGVEADLYDDQNGDGQVSVAYRAGIPYAAETPYPTVRVVAPAGWWIKAGKVNFNLDLQVDGPVEAAFNSEVYLSRLKTDGQPDFQVTVRDTRGTGRPDFERIDAWPGAPESWGIDRSQLMVNPNGNEVPITNNLFWPYLGTALNLPSAAAGSPGSSPATVLSHPPDDLPFGFVKGYRQSFPPIQVYWPAARIAYVGEFVASRGSGSNWFLYSINRLRTGQSNANFENPFAFYDLANAGDGYPDLQIRDEYYGPDDRFLAHGELRTPSDLIRYSWDQSHQHHWDFKLDLIGRNTIDSIVNLPSLDVRTVPYAGYPTWVVDHSWDAADFVAVEQPDFWTSEGVYDSFGVDTRLRDTFQTGRQSNPPELDAANWPVGFRGEYDLSLHDQPWLYFSPVDRKLHLLHAQFGLWKLGNAREIHYGNLGGPYLNKWDLYDQGRLEKTLVFVGSQLILADADGVRIKTVDVDPGRFTVLPPTSHRSWTSLREQVDANAPSFAPDDFSAMFEQFPGPVQDTRGGTLSDLKTSSDGFSFSLRLSVATPRGATWLSGLQPGAYRISYHVGSGYTAEALQLAPLRLTPVNFVGERPAALQPVVLETTVENPANEDRPNVKVRFTVSNGGHAEQDLGSARVRVPANGSTRATITWIPPSGGPWLVGVASSAGGMAVPVPVLVADPPRGDPTALLALSGLSGTSLVTVGSVLGAAVLFAGLLGIVLWRSESSGRDRHDD